MRCFASWNPISRAQPDIGSADSTLYIDLTKPEDAGNYTVQVANLYGTIDHSFRIDFTPILVKDINLKEVQLEAGGRLSLEAEVSGARVRWYKDGEELRIRKTAPYDPKAYVDDRQVSTLRVSRCTVEDSGSYVGRAETEAGQCYTSSCQVTVSEGTKVDTRHGQPFNWRYEM